MKIEVGQYVRYKDLNKIIKIAKIKEILLPNNSIKNNGYFLDNNDVTVEKNIIKEPSFNIIDLIEVGDYVNGYKVIDKGSEEDGHKYISLDFDKKNDCLHWGECTEIENNCDIKSIVTKEQFESVSYKVGE